MISEANSGSRHIDRNDPALFLIFLYSGKYLPACRISQTGVLLLSLPERMFINGEKSELFTNFSLPNYNYYNIYILVVVVG